MFTIIKDKYIRCFVGLFVFMFLSVAACNSYASVCFLPGGDCGETNDDLAFWCEPDDKDCNDANGTSDEYKPEDKPEKAEKPNCTTSCEKIDGHRTCTTDSNGCPIVDKECLDDKYLTEQACESDNNGSDCKLVGTCYEVRTAPEPSGSCDGYNVAKSTLVALQTAFGVSSFDTFMSNLSTYTLEQCTACPADSTKFKCSYVGCPAGKILYLNIDSLYASENGVKSMLSNTNITDYEEFSLEPSVFAKSSSVQKDSRSYAEACIMNKIKDNTLPNVCVQSQYCNGTDIYFQDSSNNHPDANKCVIKSIYCPIKDSRGLFNLSNIEIYDHDGNNCYYQYYDVLSQTSSSTIALDECKKCLTGSNGYSLLPSNPKIQPAAITYNHSEFSFSPVDKTKRNMAIKMAQCDLSNLEECIIGADFSDLLAGVTGYETAPKATSLCLDKNNIDSDYIDAQYIPYRQSVQQLMRAGLNDKNSKYYGKEDLVDYHVYVEHEEVEETGCPSDKICFKFNYTCNGETCSKTFFENYPFNVGAMFLYGEDFEEYFYEDKENEEILEITTLNIDKSLLDNGYYNYLYIYSYADDDNYDADISYDTITKTRDFAMELQLNNNKVDISFCDSMLSDCEYYKELSASDNIIDINIDMRDCVHAKPNYINIAATCYHMNKFDCNSSDIIKSYEARMACQELKEKGCISIWSKTQKEKIEVSDITPSGDGTYIYRLPYKQCSMGDKLAITPVNQTAEDGSSVLFDQEFIFDGTYGKDITVKGTDISKSDDGKNLELYPVIKVYKKLNYTNSSNYLTAAAIIAVHDPFNLVSNDDAFVTRKDPNVGFSITYQGYSQSSVSFNESFKQMSGYDAVKYSIWEQYIPLISTVYIAEKTYSLQKSILSVAVSSKGQIDKEFVDYYVNKAGGTGLINWSNTYKLW